MVLMTFKSCENKIAGFFSAKHKIIVNYPVLDLKCFF